MGKRGSGRRLQFTVYAKRRPRASIFQPGFHPFSALRSFTDGLRRAWRPSTPAKSRRHVNLHAPAPTSTINSMWDRLMELDVVKWLQGLTWYQALTLSVGLFLIGFFGSIAFVSWVLIRLPPTYFQKHHPPVFWAERHPILRWTGFILKNLIGVILVFVGIILSLPGVPGQGLLTILIGVMLLDFPGKRRLEQAIVSRPMVFAA